MMRAIPIMSDYRETTAFYGSSWIATPGRGNCENPRMIIEQGSIDRRVQQLLAKAFVKLTLRIRHHLRRQFQLPQTRHPQQRPRSGHVHHESQDRRGPQLQLGGAARQGLGCLGDGQLLHPDAGLGREPPRRTPHRRHGGPGLSGVLQRQFPSLQGGILRQLPHRSQLRFGTGQRSGHRRLLARKAGLGFRTSTPTTTSSVTSSTPSSATTVRRVWSPTTVGPSSPRSRWHGASTRRNS